MLSVPLLDEDIIGCIIAYNRRDKEAFSITDQEILTTLAEQATIAIENATLYEEQQKMMLGTVRSLARILDYISPKTYTHSGRFVDLVMAMAREMKLSQQDTAPIYYAAVLHDAGEVGIKDAILKKTDKLNRHEVRIIRGHPASGVSIIEPLDILKPVVPIVLHHHERYDGRGYPDRLKGDQIPVGARIMAVADAFEAMVMSDFLSGLIKSIVFGAIICSVCCYEGLHVSGGAKGVGQSTMKSVVMSFIFIVLADFFFTVFFYMVPIA